MCSIVIIIATINVYDERCFMCVKWKFEKKTTSKDEKWQKKLNKTVRRASNWWKEYIYIV